MKKWWGEKLSRLWGGLKALWQWLCKLWSNVRVKQGTIVAVIIGGAGLVLEIMPETVQTLWWKWLGRWWLLISLFIFIVGFAIHQTIKLQEERKKKPSSTTSPATPNLPNRPDYKKDFNNVRVDIERLQYILLEERKFYPDIIIGVYGKELIGGVIVGAWLASNAFLKKPGSFWTTVRDRKIGQDLAAEIIGHPNLDTQRNEKLRILVIDDESQTGGTVNIVYERLKDALKQELQKKRRKAVSELEEKLDIRVAVLVVREKSWKDYQEKYWRREFCISIHQNVPPDSKDYQVNWPWKT